jgi:HK97 family phage major capsid protein
LSLNKLYSLAAISYELEEDAIISIADIVAAEMARQGAKKLDEAAFNGDGTSTYGGITGVRNALLNLHATRSYIAGLHVGAGNAYSEITAADLVTVKSKLPAYARNTNTRWFMSPDVYGAIAERLIIAAAGVLPNDIVNGVGGDRLLGIPVVFSEVMPKVEANDQVCMFLGDLSLSSTLGKGSQVAMLRDTSVGWATDTIQYKTRWRVDAVTHDVGNAHATATSRQAGPVVGLLTAAS